MRATILLFWFVITTCCEGCFLLPHHPCLIYYGDVQNVHGFGEIGRGGDLYREAGVSYVFNPWLVVTKRGLDCEIVVSDFQQDWYRDAGLTIVLQCSANDGSNALHRTSVCGLKAWLVRDQEYPFRAVKPALNETFHAWKDADYSPLFDASKPLPAGVWPLVGGVRLSIHDGRVTDLRFDLVAIRSVPRDLAWLTRNEQVAGRDLRDGWPRAADDSAAWEDLRSRKPASAPAHIGGEFITEQCINYFQMP
jgi:hypothetical protein